MSSTTNSTAKQIQIAQSSTAPTTCQPPWVCDSSRQGRQDNRSPAHLRQRRARGANLYTDTHQTYRALAGDFAHETVDHAEAYVVGQIHTNGLENFWSLLKRGLHGTYVSVEPFHLFRYLDERLFTYNLRDLTDLGRFTAVLQAATGRRLTYAELTGKA